MRATQTLILCALLLAPAASGEVPSLVSLSGRLTDTSGSPVAGPVSLAFALYNHSTEGALLWSETHGSVGLSNGVFSVLLGSVEPLNLSFNESYWVAITVNGELQNPRLRLAAAPYAMAANRSQNATYADRAAVAENVSCAGCVNATALAPGTATTLAQGWDACGPGQNASFVLVAPAQGFAEVRLYLFAERALAYERADAYERAVGVGNVSWTPPGVTVENGSSIATSGPSAWDNVVEFYYRGFDHRFRGGGFATEGHTHSVTRIFQHNHSITTQTTPLDRTDAPVNRTGGLPAEVSLFVDGTNRTDDLTWTTRNPAQPRDEMLNDTITAWASASGVHWLDVSCDAPGAVRFVVSAR